MGRALPRSRRPTPCAADPESYDLDPDHGAPHATVEQLVQACRTRCPIYELCSQLEHDEVYGVVGGRYRPYPVALPEAATSNASPATARALRHLAETLALLHPGDKLPSLRVVTQAAGVSRPAVRNAVDRLETAGLVQAAPGREKGFIVPSRPDHDSTPALAGAVA